MIDGMCALIYEVSVPLGDLRHLAVRCNACDTVMIVDLGGKTQTTVTFCPTCRHDFEPAVKDRVRSLASLLDALGASTECSFAFRIAAPELRRDREP
jgi:hypothetical protein